MSLTKTNSPSGVGTESDSDYFRYVGPSLHVRREVDEWDLERAMNDYVNSYGPDAFAEKVEMFMIERGIY